MRTKALSKAVASAIAALACGFGVVGVTLAQGGQGPAVRPAASERTLSEENSEVRGQETRELTRDDLQGWLDAFMPYALKSGEIAGAVVVVVKDGHVVLEKGYGLADVATDRPVDVQSTLFRPGSISKTFTYTAVMQLVEQGKIDLDVDVNRYLDFEIPKYGAHPITMRHLLTHTPGFEQSYRDLYSIPSIGVPDLRTVLTQQIPRRVYPAGEVPAYSNYGSALAGYIVERVSGQSFDEYVTQHIFMPLDMRSATFEQPLPESRQARMSNGYNLASGAAKPYELIGPYPAGSLAATGSDMGKWMIAHLQDGEYQGRRILRPETARLMHETTSAPINPVLEQGVLGFAQKTINGRRTIGHGGNSQWFHSDMVLFIDDHVGIFMSLNSRGRDYAALPIEKYILTTFADRYFPRAADTPRSPLDVKTARAHAAAMAGNYNMSETAVTNFWTLRNLSSQVKVTSDDQGRLLVKRPGGDGKAVYQEVAPWVWDEVEGDGKIAARVKDGKVQLWSTGGSQAMIPVPFYRDADWVSPVAKYSIWVLLLMAAIWPVSFVVRHYYRAEFPFTGTLAVSYRSVRVAAVASGGLLLVWMRLLTHMSVSKEWQSHMIPWIMSLHILSIFVFPGAFIIALWHAWNVWREESTSAYLEKASSIVIVLGTFAVLWISIAFNLISVRAAF